MAKFFPLKLIPDNTHINFMGQKRLGFLLSVVLILVSVACIGIRGFNFGIDFSGGTVIEARMKQVPDLANMRSLLTKLDVGDISLQSFGTAHDVMIRVGQKSGKEVNQMHTIEKIKALLAKEFSDGIEYRKIDFVGPQVGKELIFSGSLALLLAFAGIMVYVWIRFEWQYGVGALLALMHDALLALGFLSITQLEFNLTSVAAILTIIGYSINDSVVIYDRIRENMRKYKKKPMDEVLNISMNETLSRTILTVTTVLLTALSLVLFGGEVLRSFSVTILFGLLAGTYSSVYISAPILTYLNLRKTTNKSD